jgi:hypothetical protein
MKIIICFLLLIISVNTYAQKNIKYEYKKHEKFDFSALEIEGGQSSPGDLSIAPRFRKEFKNKIPERKEFQKEMKRALDAVR